MIVSEYCAVRAKKGKAVKFFVGTKKIANAVVYEFNWVNLLKIQSKPKSKVKIVKGIHSLLLFHFNKDGSIRMGGENVCKIES